MVKARRRAVIRYFSLVIYGCFLALIIVTGNKRSEIVTSNVNNVKSIQSSRIIHEYGEENDKGYYHWAEVSFLYDKKRIIGAHYDDGFIKIYDFDTEKLVKKFAYEKNEHNFSFCLWNEKYIIVGYIYSLKIFNIEEGILVKEINSIFSGWGILTIFKFYHSSLEDCLICNCHSGASVHRE